MERREQVNFRFVAGLVLVALLAGCMQPPDDPQDVLQIPIPGEWSDGVADSGQLDDWVADLGDPQLPVLIEEALGSNFQLQAGLARLDQATALARIEGSGRWPTATVLGDAVRRDNNGAFDPSNSFSVVGAVNWELDIWGRVRAQARAAGADLEAATEVYRGAKLSLAVGVAQAWYSAVTQYNQAALARETLDSFESNLKTVEERFQRGLSPALDLRLTRANVANARSNYHLQRRLTDAAVRRLEVLLGRYPAGSLELVDSLPNLGSEVPAGLPSELLRRRPDLVAAERDVYAAGLRLRESKLSLLPSIDLTGRLGRASSELDDLLESSFDIWSLAGGLTAPLFQGGRLRANVDRSEAQLAQAIADYQQTALIAFREVETALVDETLLREQLAAVELSAEESTGAQQLAEERYQRGLADIVTVLESQRRAFNARSSLLSIKNQILQNRLSLYLALGGGAQSNP